MRRWCTLGSFSILSLVLLSYVDTQFHLYHTVYTASNSPLFFDCLYYRVLDNIVRYEDLSKHFRPAVQNIPYCIRPDSRDPRVENEEKENKTAVSANKLTFDQLQRSGVTIFDLLAWSAPIDILELYQDFLRNPTNVTIHHSFYNCTWPWFGPMCQYTFDTVEIHSFNSIVRDTFIEKLPAEPNDYHYPARFTNLTCYTNLTCNRGPRPFCLDWREICDGQIDCLDNGTDEIGCFHLQANKCEKDEFQCDNGMCVPSKFENDSPYNFDCMDASDEKDSIIGQGFFHCIHDPAFRCEELAYIDSGIHLFCGDGQMCSSSIEDKWCCRNGRSAFLHETLMSRLANTDIMDDKCWFIMYCAINAFDHIVTDCTSLCPRGRSTCRFDIGAQCASPYVIFPQQLVLPGHVHFMYLTNRTIVNVKGYVLHLKSPDHV
jgi:hypothetical protein